MGRWHGPGHRRSERAYLKSSGDERDEERLEEERRRAREAQTERRSARRLRGLVAVFAAATLIAGALTVIAVNRAVGRTAWQLGGARGPDRDGEGAHRGCADEPGRGSELSVGLAVAAVEATRSVDGTVIPDAVAMLHRAIAGSRLELEVTGVGVLAWSPAGVFVSEGPTDSGIIDIRDSDPGEVSLVRGTRRRHQRRRLQRRRLEARVHRGRRHAEGVGCLDRAARPSLSRDSSAWGPSFGARDCSSLRPGTTGRFASWTVHWPRGLECARE